jgi:hypothetical protein
LHQSSLHNGNSIKKIAMTVIGLAIGRVKKKLKSPSDRSSNYLSFGSAIVPRTTARTAGAKG